MQKRKALKRKNNLIILVVMTVMFLTMSMSHLQASTEIQPADNQYLEMRATTITDVNGQGKQLIMELWGHEIDFKRF